MEKYISFQANERGSDLHCAIHLLSPECADVGGCGFLTEAKVSLYLTLSIFPVNVTDMVRYLNLNLIGYLNLNLNGLLLTRKIDNTSSNQLFVSEFRRSKDFLVTTLDNVRCASDEKENAYERKECRRFDFGRVVLIIVRSCRLELIK